jgi:hypothetical protein
VILLLTFLVFAGQGIGCGGRCHDLRGYSLEKIRSMRGGGGRRRGGEIESYNIPSNTPLSYASVA